MHGLRRRTAAAWRWPVADKLTFALAWPLLLLAAILLRLVHIRHLARLLGVPVGPVCYVPLPDPRQDRRARIVRRAIRRAANASPLRADCLPQALAGALMCRWLRVPVAAHLGVKLGATPGMEAHAWLCSGRVAITGGDSFGRYTAVSCFVTGGAR